MLKSQRPCSFICYSCLRPKTLSITLSYVSICDCDFDKCSYVLRGMDLANLSSNWKRLQKTIAAENSTSTTENALKRKRPQLTTLHPPRKRSKSLQTSRTHRVPKPRRKMNTPIEQILKSETKINSGLNTEAETGKYLALDCEMVGVGPNGAESMLARVSIVNYNGTQIYDSYVQPVEQVIDYRTAVSGIKPHHLRPDAARRFEDVQKDVAELLKGRVVVGHALRHDFKALLLDHPLRDLRDTSRLPAYRKLAGGTPKLSLLASELLGLEIQSGEHSSLEDARACMLLFRRDKAAFEERKGSGRKA